MATLSLDCERFASQSEPDLREHFQGKDKVECRSGDDEIQQLRYPNKFK